MPETGEDPPCNATVSPDGTCVEMTGTASEHAAAANNALRYAYRYGPINKPYNLTSLTVSAADGGYRWRVILTRSAD